MAEELGTACGGFGCCCCLEMILLVGGRWKGLDCCSGCKNCVEEMEVSRVEGSYSPSSGVGGVWTAAGTVGAGAGVGVGVHAARVARMDARSAEGGGWLGGG